MKFWTVMSDFEVFELREGLSEILAVDLTARYVLGDKHLLKFIITGPSVYKQSSFFSLSLIFS